MGEKGISRQGLLLLLVEMSSDATAMNEPSPVGRRKYTLHRLSS